jgi:hypothetical protein
MKRPQKEPGPRHLGQPVPPKESEPNGGIPILVRGARPAPGPTCHRPTTTSHTPPRRAHLSVIRWHEEPHRQRVHAAADEPPTSAPRGPHCPASGSGDVIGKRPYNLRAGGARAPVTPDPAPTTSHGHGRVARERPNPTDAYESTTKFLICPRLQPQTVA